MSYFEYLWGPQTHHFAYLTVCCLANTLMAHALKCLSISQHNSSPQNLQQIWLPILLSLYSFVLIRRLTEDREKNDGLSLCSFVFKECCSRKSIIFFKFTKYLQGIAYRITYPVILDRHMWRRALTLKYYTHKTLKGKCLNSSDHTFISASYKHEWKVINSFSGCLQPHSWE